MTTNDRHDTNIDLLDSIIGIAGGVTKETRRLSFRMEKAVRGEQMRSLKQGRELWMKLNNCRTT